MQSNCIFLLISSAASHIKTCDYCSGGDTVIIIESMAWVKAPSRHHGRKNGRFSCRAFFSPTNHSSPSEKRKRELPCRRSLKKFNISKPAAHGWPARYVTIFINQSQNYHGRSPYVLWPIRAQTVPTSIMASYDRISDMSIECISSRVTIITIMKDIFSSWTLYKR